MHVFPLTFNPILSITESTMNIQAVDHVGYSYIISILSKITMSSFVALIP